MTCQLQIDGMQFLLCRENDITKPCCRNLAYYRNEKLWCVDCKRPRGRLAPLAITGLLALLAIYPGIMKQTHVLRDKGDLPNEELERAAYSLVEEGNGNRSSD
jgi:hypothetical protein